MNDPIIPVILAGGAGTRLWPLSRESYPKQFLQLLGNDSLLQATLRRARQITPHNPIVISHHDYRFIVSEQVAAKDLGPIQLLLEPDARGTAVAIGCAAHLALQRSADAIIFVMAADHIIENEQSLHKALTTAAPAAALGQLMTFGITPRFAATGYGYIARGAENSRTPGCYAINQFVEKPDALRAQNYLQSGDWLWNAGMFLFRADCYLHELRTAASDIAEAAEVAVFDAIKDGNAIRLAAAAYETCPNLSIDHAVMEHAAHAGVVPCDLGWHDIGSWSALWDMGAKDADDNVIHGDVIMHATKNCYIRSEQQLITTYGLEDAIVVATPDVVMVSSRHQPQDIMHVIAKLQIDQRQELTRSRRLHRPWGMHETIVDGENFCVNRMIIKPNMRLSLQRHQHRSEHWVVVSGAAEVEIIESKTHVKKELRPNTSAYIPRGAMHRLTNIGTEILEVIEIQCGDYLGDDDIEVFSDDAA
jgi:mannose-1-phosphate guanylyltransferase/mannose-6-phosphate isomerase